MPDYKVMYYELFNKVSHIIEELQAIQLQTEEMYTLPDGSKISRFDVKSKGLQNQHQANKRRRST